MEPTNFIGPQAPTPELPKKSNKLKWFLLGGLVVFLVVLVGVIAFAGFMASSVLVSVNPGEQFQKARDTQRQSDVIAIGSAIYQYASENDGELPPGFPSKETCVGSSAPCYNLAQWLVPKYLESLPVDPNGKPVNTGYTVFEDTKTRRVVVRAEGEQKEVIEARR